MHARLPAIFLFFCCSRIDRISGLCFEREKEISKLCCLECHQQFYKRVKCGLEMIILECGFDACMYELVVRKGIGELCSFHLGLLLIERDKQV